jgi:LysR family transcriptional regulator, nitrogen assimilation regulatory protein
MNLRQLHYFVEVSEIQSVTRAAARLNVAQPALTRHMRALERDLGVQLFARSGRGMALTNAGTVFRDRVKSILRDLDRARLEVQALSRTPGGRIDIGMPASISQALTRVLVQRVGERLPKVAIRVIDGWSGFIVEWLLLGRLEVGIIYDYALRSNLLQVEPLATERQFLTCKAGDPLARRGRPIALEEVAALPLVLPSLDHGLRVAFEHRMQAAGLTPRIELEIESVIAIKQFIDTGGLYSILPRGEIGEDISAGRLAVVATEPALERTLSLAWPRDRQIEHHMQPLIDIIRGETAALVETGAWGTSFLGPRPPGAGTAQA